MNIDGLKNVATNLCNLESKLNKLDVNQVIPVPVDLSKLGNLVNKDAIKRELYNVKIKNIEDKTADITNLAIITTLNAKMNEVKSEIPSITKLATTTA